MHFNRQTGTNILVRNLATTNNVRIAQRSLQIGLLTACNLSCNFYHHDKEAKSLLTPEFLLDLLIKAHKWGVHDVAFGGGEPLMFKGFTQLVKALNEQTQLGINFTNNGLLLTEQKIQELADFIGEIRLSIYGDNDYRQTLHRARQ